MYKNPAAPLAELSGPMRAAVIEDIIEHLSPQIFSGHKLARPTTAIGVGTAYEFLLDGRVRVGVKSSMLDWDTTQNCWKVTFENVSFGADGRCFFIILDLDALHIVEHRTDSYGGKNGDGAGPHEKDIDIDVGANTISIYGSTGALNAEAARARVKADKKMKKKNAAAHQAKINEYIDAGTPATAVDHILKKLIYWGSVYVARVNLPALDDVPPR